MNKKVISIACAVIAFFVGAVWVDVAPIFAPLVAFLEVCAGFACGYFYNKAASDPRIAELEETVVNLKSNFKACLEREKATASKKTATKKEVKG